MNYVLPTRNKLKKSLCVPNSSLVLNLFFILAGMKLYHTRKDGRLIKWNT